MYVVHLCCRYPVFLLTEAGDVQRVDPRLNSLRDAVYFAQQHHLLGMCSARREFVSRVSDCIVVVLFQASCLGLVL